MWDEKNGQLCTDPGRGSGNVPAVSFSPGKREKAAARRRILEGIGHCLPRIRSKPGGGTSPVFLALSLYFLGRRITDRLFPVRLSAQNLFSPGENLTLYHWFPAECRESVRREGLRPKAANGLVFLTDRPDFPHISPYFCQKVLEAGRDIAFCPVRIDTGKLSQYQKIYSTDRSYEFAVRAVPPACLDFPETE